LKKKPTGQTGKARGDKRKVLAFKSSNKGVGNRSAAVYPKLRKRSVSRKKEVAKNPIFENGKKNTAGNRG